MYNNDQNISTKKNNDNIIRKATFALNLKTLF